jgi:hypothetical protein
MPVEAASILAENLAALSSGNPGLAAAVAASVPDPRLAFLSARTGILVPAVRSPHGAALLHSLVDPERESRRLHEALRGAGIVVILGLGAGTHVIPFLEDPAVSAILVVEKDHQVLRSLLERMPLAPILRDARVRLEAGLEGIRPWLLAAWHPVLTGSLRTVPLRAWCECERGFFRSAASEVQGAVDSVRADYGVQSHFGKRWMWNILQNMERAEGAVAQVPRGDSARVTAAGPSLDRAFEALRRAGAPGRNAPGAPGRNAPGFLLATDTSLPALLRAGIRPDGVVSIDCQIHGYHHFLQGLPRETCLFLDLASPPFLARRAARVAFCTSAHPFASYLDAHWMSLPHLDTSGGNVTHAAVSLARSLGAGTITLYGADFSYPAGKPYARGTYLYDLFDREQSRLSPTESRLFSFVLRSPDTSGERVGTGMRYTTGILRDYRDRLVRLIRDIDARVIAVDGGGLPLDLGTRSGPGSGPGSSSEPWKRPVRKIGWRDFLARYAGDLAALPGLGARPGRRFSGLAPGDRQLWSTLLPVAARVFLETGEPAEAGTALEEARGWTLERVSRALTSR